MIIFFVLSIHFRFLFFLSIHLLTMSTTALYIVVLEVCVFMFALFVCYREIVLCLSVCLSVFLSVEQVVCTSFHVTFDLFIVIIFDVPFIYIFFEFFVPLHISEKKRNFYTLVY